MKQNDNEILVCVVYLRLSGQFPPTVQSAESKVNKSKDNEPASIDYA